ncbi:MAG: dihydrodipicolinate synthase family protein [Alphaproteobacteria bacterium]|nr:dihydrodipicolinate synthase family protein [Alphaproteobacteria bacterium]
MNAYALSGVFPIVPTPFLDDGRPAEADLARVVDYIVKAGADGLVFPGVASEFDTLRPEERRNLVDLVARANGGRKPLIVGVSAGDAAASIALAQQARDVGAAAVMAMNPASLRDDPAGIAAYYRAVAAIGLPIVLQNAPPPLGSALTMDKVARLVDTIPGVDYVKEETMPCGQRISQLLALAPVRLKGVFGGAGGRYITDELARGAVGTMPAAELTELHVRQFACHRAGDAAGVRALFNRMLPLLNFQAVFRMAMTKEVLRRRGVIEHTHVRAAGPRLDDGDRRELDAMMAELADILAPKVAVNLQ